MIKNKTILFLMIISLCTSCKAQEIKIVMNDKINIELETTIEVFNLIKKDTVVVKPTKEGHYQIKSDKENHLLIRYKSKMFDIENLNLEVKSIFIDYDNKAENNCYVINKVFSDAVQSSNIKGLKNCSSITNIYLYREYVPNRESPPSVKLRTKN